MKYEVIVIQMQKQFTTEHFVRKKYIINKKRQVIFMDITYIVFR